MAVEPASAVAGRARRVLVAAKVRQKDSWDDCFAAADKDRSKTLDIKELKTVLRERLKIPESMLSDYEIHSVYGEIDLDQSGHIDSGEFLKFVSHGPRRPEDEARLFAIRTKRVHRNLRLAFKKFRTDQAAIQKLFEHVDRGGDNKISMNELLAFVRFDLQLSQWDIFESELKAFYKAMDQDGNGVDVEEFLQFLQTTKPFAKEKGSGNSVEKFSFVEDSRPSNVRRQPTYRMQLMSERMTKSASAGDIGTGRTRLPSVPLTPTPSFVNLGRTRPAIVR